MTALVSPPGPLLIATHNAGKLREFRQLLHPLGFQVLSAGDANLEEPEETGLTFEANAQIKSLAAARVAKVASLSDDSGLCVDGLEGAPGIYSARWAGPSKDFAKAMEDVNDQLNAKGLIRPEQRRAKFVAVLSLADPDGSMTTEFRGEVHGHIVWPPRGNNGFGYDACFQPDDEICQGKTFGELSAEEKHGWAPGAQSALSHRARAFKLFARDALGLKNA